MLVRSKYSLERDNDRRIKNRKEKKKKEKKPTRRMRVFIEISYICNATRAPRDEKSNKKIWADRRRISSFNVASIHCCATLA